MIAANQYFPHDLTELDRSTHEPRWARVGQCFYWHEPTIHLHPEQTRSKFSHTAKSFNSIAGYDRHIFILANTQNNLPEVDQRLNGFNFRLDDESAGALSAALQGLFGTIELYIVSYQTRNDLDKYRNALFEIEPDRSAVGGDPQQWRAIYSKILKNGADPAASERI